MFFVIGGIQPKTVRLEKQARTCSACGHLALYLKRVDHYLSLFFIPLFPVKKGIPFLICEHCQAVDDEHGRRPERSKFGIQIRCPSCGKPLNPDFSYCPYCGQAL